MSDNTPKKGIEEWYFHDRFEARLEAETSGYLPLGTPATSILYVLHCGSCSISAHVPPSFFPSRHRVPPQCLTVERPMTSTLSCQLGRHGRLVLSSEHRTLVPKAHLLLL